MPVLKVIDKETSPFYISTLGKYMDYEALPDVISYCTKLGNACRVGGIAVYPPNAIFEMERLAQAYEKDSGLRLRHWILSFSVQDLKTFRKADRLEMLYRFGWYAASYYGGQYQILFAVHLTNHNPHIHFVMNTVNYRTGYKYPGDIGSYYAYQQYLKDFFRTFGMTLIVVSDQ